VPKINAASDRYSRAGTYLGLPGRRLPYGLAFCSACDYLRIPARTPKQTSLEGKNCMNDFKATGEHGDWRTIGGPTSSWRRAGA
jgi:hypothetical protein